MERAVPLFGVVKSDAIEQAALEVLRSGQIASGPYVEAFRARFGAAIGNDHLVTTSDMSSAMTIALRLADVRPGSEVIAMPFACLSTNAPLAATGADARWADMDPATASLDVADVARLITPLTRAVILYHVAGYPGPAREIAELCRAANVALIEDCDNALGAECGDRPVGGFGDFAVYSFYPNRQINGIDGGAIACRDPADAARAARLRRFGTDPTRFRDGLGEIDPGSDIAEIGWAAAMNNLNSAVALAQIDGVGERLVATRSNAERLAGDLTDVPPLELVQPRADCAPAYWALLARVGNREDCLAQLKRRGIAVSKLHHRNDGYSGFGAPRRPLPGVDAFSATAFGIPCGWWLTESDLDRVASAVRDVVSRFGRPVDNDA